MGANIFNSAVHVRAAVECPNEFIRGTDHLAIVTICDQIQWFVCKTNWFPQGKKQLIPTSWFSFIWEGFGLVSWPHWPCSVHFDSGCLAFLSHTRNVTWLNIQVSRSIANLNHSNAIDRSMFQSHTQLLQWHRKVTSKIWMGSMPVPRFENEPARTTEEPARWSTVVRLLEESWETVKRLFEKVKRHVNCLSIAFNSF